MQIAHEAIAQSPQRLGMAIPQRSSLAVEGVAAGAREQRAPRPTGPPRRPAAVADEAGVHRPPAPRCYGHGRGARVIAPGLRRGVARGIIPELAEHPGAEDDTESGQGTVEGGVRVRLKMGREVGVDPRSTARRALPAGPRWRGCSPRTPGAPPGTPRGAGCAARPGSRRRARSRCRWRPPGAARRGAGGGSGAPPPAGPAPAPAHHPHPHAPSPGTRPGRPGSNPAGRCGAGWSAGVRSQISCCWVRAKMRTAATASLSPATGR